MKKGVPIPFWVTVPPPITPAVCPSFTPLPDVTAVALV